MAKRLAKLLWNSEPDKALAEAAGGLNQRANLRLDLKVLIEEKYLTAISKQAALLPIARYADGVFVCGKFTQRPVHPQECVRCRKGAASTRSTPVFRD